jgi:protein SCO1
MNRTFLPVLGLAALALGICPARAQMKTAANGQISLRDIGIDQKLNSRVPLDLPFRDQDDKPVRLGDYFSGKKPVLLALVYYKCPRLCQLQLDGLAQGLHDLRFNAGKEFEIVAVSIDPRETPKLAADKRWEMVGVYGRPGTERGWHFLTGEESSIRPLAEAVGFRYVYNPMAAPSVGPYAHAAGIQILTPDGHVARYLNGIVYAAKDLRLGIVEASKGKIGTPLDKVLLMTCFAYDPARGKYGFAIMKLLQTTGILTAGILATFMIVMFRMDRRRALTGLDGQDARLADPERKDGR